MCIREFSDHVLAHLCKGSWACKVSANKDGPGEQPMKGFLYPGLSCLSYFYSSFSYSWSCCSRCLVKIVRIIYHYCQKGSGAVATTATSLPFLLLLLLLLLLPVPLLPVPLLLLIIRIVHDAKYSLYSGNYGNLVWAGLGRWVGGWPVPPVPLPQDFFMSLPASDARTSLPQAELHCAIGCDFGCYEPWS